jgi:hypothetical protein
VAAAVRDRRPRQRAAIRGRRGPGSGQPAGAGAQQGWRGRVGVLADRVGPAAPPACWPAGLADRSSWVTAGQPARSPASTWTRPAGGRGCRTGEPPSCFACAPGGRCISYSIRPSPTPPRTAPTFRCCSPGPGTPRSGPWSAMPARDPRQSPATSPTPTQHAGDRDPPRTTSRGRPQVTMWWTSFPIDDQGGRVGPCPPLHALPSARLHAALRRLTRHHILPAQRG